MRLIREPLVQQFIVKHLHCFSFPWHKRLQLNVIKYKVMWQNALKGTRCKREASECEPTAQWLASWLSFRKKITICFSRKLHIYTFTEFVKTLAAHLYLHFEVATKKVYKTDLVTMDLYHHQCLFSISTIETDI